MRKYILKFIISAVFIFGAYFFVEAKEQRYISLSPGTTEILFALGLDDEIVGVTSFCNYPKKALLCEKIGNFSQPDIEKIIFLKPDIIFATGFEQAPVVRKLRQLGLKVFVSDPSSIKELFNSIAEMGVLTNSTAKASNLVSSMKSDIKKVTDKTKNIALKNKKKVFIEIWHDPLMTAGPGSFVDEMITLAGGINIAYDTPRAYSRFSAECVIKREPDLIILGSMGRSGDVKSLLGWRKVNITDKKHICYSIEADLFMRPGPRLVQGLAQIYKRLYEYEI